MGNPDSVEGGWGFRIRGSSGLTGFESRIFEEKLKRRYINFPEKFQNVLKIPEEIPNRADFSEDTIEKLEKESKRSIIFPNFGRLDKKIIIMRGFLKRFGNLAPNSPRNCIPKI